MQVSFDLDNVREAANAIAIVNLVYPGLIEQLSQPTAQPPAPESYPEDGVVPDMPSQPLRLVVDELAVPEKKYTQEEVNTAITGYAAKHSMAKGLELLKEFGCNRASDLPEEKRAAFIGRIQEIGQ